MIRRNFIKLALAVPAAVVVVKAGWLKGRPVSGETELRGIGRAPAELKADRYVVTAVIEMDNLPSEDGYGEFQFYWGPISADPINAQLIGVTFPTGSKRIACYVGKFSPCTRIGELIFVNQTKSAVNAEVKMEEITYAVHDDEHTISLEHGETVTIRVKEIKERT